MTRLPFKTAHFVGIGGIGMSGIARLFLSAGCRVQGTDVQRGAICGSLEEQGAKIFIGHDPAHVRGADLLIYSSSIPEMHPERLEALRLGIPVWHRSQALQQLCQGKRTVAVSGTHGKTTTTALIALILQESGCEPSAVVGGWVKELGGNARAGSGEIMVIEADESDGSFTNYTPDIAVVTNIEEEHLDHYSGLDGIRESFRDFLKKLNSGGQWFGCAEDARVRDLAAQVPGARLYGWSDQNHLWADAVEECPDGQRGIAFRAWEGRTRLGPVRMRIPGRHNVLNALAAIGVARSLGVDFETISAALARYEGAGRRFDVKFENGDYLVVDDYAHHPTEISSTLQAAKGLRRNRIIALFQPHRYSRTEALLESFGRSFSQADKIFLTDIYAASEKPRDGVTGQRLYDEVKKNGHPDARFVTRESLADRARSEIRPGDLVLVMGAGDISQVASQLAECLKKNGTLGGLFSGLRGKVSVEEPLSKHSSLKIGGPAEFWLEPADIEDLKEALRLCKQHGLRVTVFGAGSNVLAPDEGLRGAAIHLGAPYFKGIRADGETLTAGAGVPNTLFIQYAYDRGFGGFEFLSGIPGNIGGAIAMNAGSHGQWIAPFIESVTLMDPSGTVIHRKASELRFAYRQADLAGGIVLEARFRFPKADPAQVRQKLEEYRDYRAKTQDLQHASAGCLFKNPMIEGCSSGRLIDEAGLKGFRVGQAQVSEKHANFLINLGGAKASEVRLLIEHVRAAVLKKHGILLQTEVKILE